MRGNQCIPSIDGMFEMKRGGRVGKRRQTDTGGSGHERRTLIKTLEVTRGPRATVTVIQTNSCAKREKERDANVNSAKATHS